MPIPFLLIGGAILVGFGYWYIYLTPDTCCNRDSQAKSNNVVPIDNNIQIPPSNNQNINTDMKAEI